MENRKYGHFDAEEKSWDADSDIRVLEATGSFDGTGGGKEGDENGLPEGKKDDEFDRCNFEQRTMLGEIVFQLNIELDEAIHCDCDAAAFDYHYLEYVS